MRPVSNDRRRGLRVVIADEQGRRLRLGGLSSWLHRVAPARARGSVSIALVSDRRIRALNRAYRRRDCATDVLSFPAFARPERDRATARLAKAPKARRRPAAKSFPPSRTQRTPRNKTVLISASSVSSAVETAFLGDIVIARGVAGRQARDAGHSNLTELKILALHGLLHLLGYGHERDGGKMRRVEERLRRKGGLREGLIERARKS